MIIGGEAIKTAVIRSTLTFSGDVDGSIRVTSWVAPDIGMAVRIEETRDLSYGVFRHTRGTRSDYETSWAR